MYGYGNIFFSTTSHQSAMHNAGLLFCVIFPLDDKRCTHNKFIKCPFLHSL